MILIWKIGSKEKKIGYENLDACASCGRYNKYNIYRINKYFSFFFIPIIKWKKRFFVQSNCCGSIFELEKNVGKSIERRENVLIKREDLKLLSSRTNSNSNYEDKECANCRTNTSSEFKFCPKCGSEL